ncbi:MAG: allantoate amidohydrolase [Geminicoccaceae bacterium]
MSCALGANVMAHLHELARCTSEPGRLTRLYLTPAHKGAIRMVQGWMEEAGMTVEVDAAANVVGRYPGRSPELPALLVGSHIDTVRDAGHYDGNLGVVAAIEAVAALNAAGERLPFAIEVIAFGDEEGVRFPSKLTGSRAVAGTFEPQSLDITDQQGIRLEAALRGFGCDPAAIPGLARRRDAVLGYVELHIEQGPVLEERQLPVGLVTAIAGASRFRIDVVGQAGHAGTVPMELRKDALVASAEMILAVERRGHGAGEPGLVATVGALEVSPGAANVVPGKVTFTLDIRAPADADRLKAIEDLVAAFAILAARRHVRVKVEKFYDEPAVACDPGLLALLEAAVQRAGITPYRLPSGAGHDGLAIAALCPIAMLFVRCKGGISHNPAESITTRDADVATHILLDFLRHFPGAGDVRPTAAVAA